MKATIDTEFVRGDPECSYKHLTASVGKNADPDARDIIPCFMSTDGVDADDEVMLPDGADFSRYAKNPVVMLCHAMGQPGCYYPLPVGRAEWTSKRARGVQAGVRFTEKTEMGREVKALFDDDMLRSFSVGFRALEHSPMTRKEAESRPDWGEAFERTKGRVNVHRRWLLVELSVAPIPSNPDALVTRYKSRGILIPDWLKPNLIPTPEAPAVSDRTTDATDEVPGGDETTSETTPDLETKAAKPRDGEAEGECSCGKADCEKCRVRTKDGDPEDDSEDDGDSEEEEFAGFKRGDHVKLKAPHYKGFGVVAGVHRRGHVPHVKEDIMGSEDDPAARVKCYKAFDDGHVPTGHHVGVKCGHMTKLAQPMKLPTPKKAPAAPAHKKALIDDDLLPPLVPLTDDDVRRKQIEAAEAAAEAAVAEVQRLLGVV